MDHLHEAKDFLIVTGDCGRSDEQCALESIAHTLIAIAERLDRLIECQVVNVPIVGTIRDGKALMGDDEALRVFGPEQERE